MSQPMLHPRGLLLAFTLTLALAVGAHAQTSGNQKVYPPAPDTAPTAAVTPSSISDNPNAAGNKANISSGYSGSSLSGHGETGNGLTGSGTMGTAGTPATGGAGR